MENNTDKSIFDDFGVNEESKSNLKDISQWANTNAIVAFIGLGISFISAVTALGRVGGGGNLFGVLITIAISLLLNITLLQAANFIKKGVTQSDQGSFQSGIGKLASYFKITGILTIIFLVFMVLALFVLMMAGGSGASA